MAVRLLEAAGKGDVETLLKLVEDDPCLLGAVALSASDTPLHIACFCGHHDFVVELLKLRRDFAGELNQDGFGPLHIASANGFLDIVKVLLAIDSNLCMVKGRDRRIALHYAATKGRVHVMRELLSANVDSVEEVTALGESALHLAVKNNQFESLRVLVEHLKLYKKEYVLTKEDDQGDTILHLAVSRKQYEVIDLVLNGLALVLIQIKAGDREFEQLLGQAVAMRARGHRAADSSATNLSYHQPTTQQHKPFYKKVFEYLKYEQVKHAPVEVRNILLVVAVLITTATYQAALSPPGSVWQDDVNRVGSRNSTNGGNSTPHSAGTTILGSKKCIAHCLFMFTNSVGFVTSLHMINILTVGFHMRLELQVSTAALLLTYYIAMIAIARPNSSLLPINIFMWATILLPPLTFLLVNRPWKRHRIALPLPLPSSTKAQV